MHFAITTISTIEKHTVSATSEPGSNNTILEIVEYADADTDYLRSA